MLKKRSRERASALRKHAEKILTERPQPIRTTATADIQKLIHELNVHQIELEMQNEEIRQDQLELQEARDKYLDLYDFAPTGHFTLDHNNLIVDVNLAGSKLLGSEKHRLIGTQFTASISPDSQDAFYFHYREVLKTGSKGNCKIEMLKADGTRFHAQVISIAIPEKDGNINQFRTAVIDITERKQAEEALLVSEQNYRDSIENSPLGVRIVTKDGKTLYANWALLNIYGYSSVEELEAVPNKQRYTPEGYDEHRERVKKRKQGEHVPPSYEISIVRSDGQIRYLSVSRGEVLWNDEKQFQVVCQDITERKHAEEALVESEEKYRLLTESSLTGIYIIQDGKYAYVNDRFAQMHGYKTEEMLGISHLTLVHPDDIELVRKTHAKLFNGEQIPIPIIGQRLTKGGEVFWAEIIVCAIEYRGKPAIMGNMVDITERKQAEAKLHESEDQYRAIFENAVEGVFQSTTDGKFLKVNPALASMYGFNSPQEMITAITDMGQQLYANPEDRVRFQTLLKKYGLVKGFESEQKHNNGHKIWISVNAKAIKDEGGNILYYDGFLQDITERKQTEEERKQSYQKLRKAIDGTIQAIALTSETRDPYTAGHQKRVAKLASAIAEEMGFPQEKIEGIHVAGILHDIGKINVPSEILSKPGRLGEIEMGLVKTHSQVGYDIVKTLELPWAICPAVLQHHERMDGSGYPAGLLGKDISIEAKILAVADVVEAMASHRPYRPALGIDKALEELSKNKGKLYDPDVVDVCLKLFNEKGFKFE